jgi:hypothetical protein
MLTKAPIKRRRRKSFIFLANPWKQNEQIDENKEPLNKLHLCKFHKE